jgi:hypothetical protein
MVAAEHSYHMKQTLLIGVGVQVHFNRENEVCPFLKEKQ